MRDRADGQPGADQDLLEIGFFTVAGFGRRVDDHGGQAAAARGHVGGKPDVGEEGLASGAQTLALHHGAQPLPPLLAHAHGRERGQKGT